VFDAAAVTLTCTNKGSLMGLMKVTAVTSYKSTDDLVDTVSAIPPLVRSESLRLTAPGSMTSTTYTYDPQKRLTREVATAALAVTVTTDYSAWDTHGRPRKAHITSSPAGRAPSDQAITYDDTARTKTITTTQNGVVVSTDVVTFDANGNQIRATGSDPNGSYTSTTTISSTTKVCR
jgi:YD repeat-containing protein